MPQKLPSADELRKLRWRQQQQRHQHRLTSSINPLAHAATGAVYSSGCCMHKGTNQHWRGAVHGSKNSETASKRYVQTPAKPHKQTASTGFSQSLDRKYTELTVGGPPRYQDEIHCLARSFQDGLDSLDIEVFRVKTTDWPENPDYFHDNYSDSNNASPVHQILPALQVATNNNATDDDLQFDMSPHQEDQQAGLAANVESNADSYVQPQPPQAAASDVQVPVNIETSPRTLQDLDEDFFSPNFQQLNISDNDSLDLSFFNDVDGVSPIFHQADMYTDASSPSSVLVQPLPLDLAEHIVCLPRFAACSESREATSVDLEVPKSHLVQPQVDTDESLSSIFQPLHYTNPSIQVLIPTPQVPEPEACSTSRSSPNLDQEEYYQAFAAGLLEFPHLPAPTQQATDRRRRGDGAIRRGLHPETAVNPLVHATTGIVDSTGGCIHKEVKNKTVTPKTGQPNTDTSPSCSKSGQSEGDGSEETAQCAKAIGPTSAAVGPRTAVRGPTAADVCPVAFCASGRPDSEFSEQAKKGGQGDTGRHSPRNKSKQEKASKEAGEAKVSKPEGASADKVTRNDGEARLEGADGDSAKASGSKHKKEKQGAAQSRPANALAAGPVSAQLPAEELVAITPLMYTAIGTANSTGGCMQEGVKCCSPIDSGENCAGFGVNAVFHSGCTNPEGETKRASKTSESASSDVSDGSELGASQADTSDDLIFRISL